MEVGARVWNTKPDGSLGDRFSVFIGDEARQPRILNKKEYALLRDTGLVIQVPVEFRLDFDRDIINALRDIAGVKNSSMKMVA
jgi:hypothetical protein